jgi:hypothetical protein
VVEELKVRALRYSSEGRGRCKVGADEGGWGSVMESMDHGLSREVEVMLSAGKGGEADLLGMIIGSMVNGLPSDFGSFEADLLGTMYIIECEHVVLAFKLGEEMDIGIADVFVSVDIDVETIDAKANVLASVGAGALDIFDFSGTR